MENENLKQLSSIPQDMGVSTLMQEFVNERNKLKNQIKNSVPAFITLNMLLSIYKNADQSCWKECEIVISSPYADGDIIVTINESYMTYGIYDKKLLDSRVLSFAYDDGRKILVVWVDMEV